MKIFSYLLALFLLGSTLTPCADDDSGCQEISFQINTSDDGENHADFDFCSPLCSCHCCHSHVVTDHYEHQLSTVVYSKIKVDISDDHSHNYHYTFWHPPKQA